MTTTDTAINDNRLPAPSPHTANCAWCGVGFDSIVELLGHVDADHLDIAAVEARPAA